MPQAPAWPCAVRQCRKWSVFEAHLDNITDTVTSYISFCEDKFMPTKTFCVYNNNKPWFTGKFRDNDAYRSGHRILYTQARNILTNTLSETLLINDRHVALTSVVKKWVLTYLQTSHAPWCRSVDDAVSTGMHFKLEHLDCPGTCNRICNRIKWWTSAQLQTTQLTVPASICQWITGEAHPAPAKLAVATQWRCPTQMAAQQKSSVPKP